MLDRPNTLTVVIPESSESALKYEYSRDTRLLSLSLSLSLCTENQVRSKYRALAESRYDTNANMLYTQKRTMARAGHQRTLPFALICVTLVVPRLEFLTRNLLFHVNHIKRSIWCPTAAEMVVETQNDVWSLKRRLEISRL